MKHQVLLDLLRKEIEELHVFFQGWFNGTTDDITPLEDRLSPSFMLITPGGSQMGYDGLLQLIGSSHGRKPDISIRIEDVRLVSKCVDNAIVTYHEIQTDATRTTERISTAVFLLRSDDTPLWLHVHETWVIPPQQN